MGAEFYQVNSDSQDEKCEGETALTEGIQRRVSTRQTEVGEEELLNPAKFKVSPRIRERILLRNQYIFGHFSLPKQFKGLT